MRRLILLLPILILTAVLTMGASDCDGGDGGDKTENQRKAAVSTRAESFDRAEAKFPVKQNTNFPKRGTLVEMAAREDLVNHPWYVYVLADTGNVIGYYVAETVPINACNYLSSSEERYWNDYGSWLMTAPSLDGMYYGQAECDVWVFKDANSDAIIKLGGIKFFVADQPLNVEAEAIRVE